LNIDCTIMTDRSPEQVADAQLTDTVVHWPATLGRERVLRVYHWPAEEFGFHEFRHVIRTPNPIEIRNRAVMPARAIDYRIYLPALMEDFIEHGGHLEVAPVEAKDMCRIAERFDLVVVATPGGGFADLFPRDRVNSPYDHRSAIGSPVCSLDFGCPRCTARSCRSCRALVRRWHFRC
jgi:hypothetical protein